MEDWLKDSKELAKSEAEYFVKNLIDVANTNNLDIHFLISYDTTDRVCDIVKLIKQQTTHYLWQKYPSFLSECYWRHKIFWSDGYFACSIGEVSSAMIQKYIESQG